MLFCTALQHRRSTSSGECRTTRLGSYSSHQDDPTPSRCFAGCTGCRSSRKSCTIKTAVLTFKVRTTATPAYLSCHLQTRHSALHLRSSSTSLLSRSSSRTDFAARASVIRHQLSGTHFLGQFLIVRHKQFSNLGLKLIYFTWRTLTKIT